VDLWEIFSAPHPKFPHPDASLSMWRDYLAAGGLAAPVGAGDVHSTDAARDASRAATLVYASERSASAVLEALRERRTAAGTGAPVPFWLEQDGRTALAGQVVGEGDWRACTSDGAAVRQIETVRGRCLYAERRTADGSLLAVSAPIWIERSHAAETRV
jgi:hypothetical protein